ncbi:hypothetical protein [Nocardia uniformis]|uniref:hypothetical protein n=1 Tax=Nocardia uniformis TaxID=53432 RepID=UPI000836F401|nr:hypothetical protein [Nocardia uniformis]
MATVAAALAVTATLAGCGSDDKDSGAATSTSSIAANTTTATATDAPAPTAAALQATLTEFADPATPAADKAELVVDGDKRVALIEQMNQGLANYQVTFAVSDVQQNGAEADAKVAVTSPHGTMPDVPMNWQYTDGAWKISDKAACTILGMARAACQP